MMGMAWARVVAASLAICLRGRQDRIGARNRGIVGQLDGGLYRSCRIAPVPNEAGLAGLLNGCRALRVGERRRDNKSDSWCSTSSRWCCPGRACRCGMGT